MSITLRPFLTDARLAEATSGDLAALRAQVAALEQRITAKQAAITRAATAQAVTTEAGEPLETQPTAAGPALPTA